MSRNKLHDDMLASERAINERYRSSAKQWLVETAELAAGFIPLHRSSIWVAGTPNKGRPVQELHPIIGRVAFIDPDTCPVDGDLYVGPYYHSLDDLTVVSWAAPIASLFYEGRNADDPVAHEIGGRRTFTIRQADLTGFADDLEPGHGQDLFGATGRAELAVPEAPRPASRPRPKPEPRPAPESKSPAQEDVVAGAPRNTSDEPPTDEPPTDEQPGDVPRLRAHETVLEVVQRPKTGRLSSVLNTLQPDQYDLVTWPAERPLIVAGQPGTGKTVVAMHRAAFLTHPDRPGGSVGKVAVVGPTDEYREHVNLVSESVGGARVPVLGLSELMGRLCSANVTRMRSGPNDRVGVSWGLWSVVRRAASHLSGELSPDRKGLRRLVDALTSDGPTHRSSVKDPELSTWLLSIGSYAGATGETRFLPFLATCGLQVIPATTSRVDHLIVDEAQDVPPLVWRILVELVEDHRAISLFGDMNQRRSDWTASSWQQLAEDLELTDDDGVAPIRDLSVGYRTTQAILDFANQLLPSGERAHRALRRGVTPEVERVPRAEMTDRVLARAVSLSERHRAGICAVLSMDPKSFSDEFRRRGWSRPAGARRAWAKDGSTVFVLHPDRARGLEFDAVVVVEPNAFPKNFGRDGVLYTSLTRATQELHVVYSGALPRNLRRPR